jgi:hypothetical protein
VDKHVLVESGGGIPGLRCITGFRRGLKASGFEKVFRDVRKGGWHGLTGLYICGGSDFPLIPHFLDGIIRVSNLDVGSTRAHCHYITRHIAHAMSAFKACNVDLCISDKRLHQFI